MRVLAAVLADARHVALDVAGLQRARDRTAGRRAGSACPSRRTRRSSTAAIACAARSGSPAPEITAHACGDRVDLALVVLRRAERRAVVEVGPAVPAAVPGVLPPVPPAAPRLAPGTRPHAPRRRAARPGRRTRSARRSKNQPFQTLSPLPPAPTLFMPSFQSPVPISGRPCGPSRSAVLQRPHAVLVERSRSRSLTSGRP